MTQKKTFKWEWGTLESAMIPAHVRDAAKRITERTNGELNVELYGRDFVSEKEIFSAVGSGQLDMAFTWSGTAGPGVLHHCDVGQLPLCPTGIAGCMFTKALVDKYFRSEMEAFGVTPIALEINSAYDFGYFTAPYLCQVWSNKMFTSLKEAAGARISAQLVMSGDACSVIGMEPKIMTYAEMKPALAADSLDGFLLPGIGPMFHTLDDLTPFCLKIDYPEAYDDFTIMNLKTYNSLPDDVRNIIIEEVRNWQALITDRPKVAKTGWDNFWNERIKDGRLKMIELTPDEKASCKQLWEEKSINEWITRQTAKGFKDARAYLDELLELRESILASGLPQYTGPIY